MPEKLSVMRCDLASCRGGVDGCNGSECIQARWDRVTPEQARDLYGIGELMQINDERLFMSKGGALPPSAATSWTADQVLAELVASPEKDRLKILKKYDL